MSAPSPIARYPARHARAWAWFLGVAGAGVAAYQLTSRGALQDVLYAGFGFAAVAAIEVGVRVNRPAQPLPWHLMALGNLLWAAGDALGSVLTAAGRGDAFPSPADAVYLLGYPFLAAALLLLIRGRRPRRDPAGMLDSAIVTVALGLLSWVLLARPTIEGYRSSVSAAGVAAAYPLADIVLVGLLVRLVTTPGGRTRAYRLLLTAVSLLVVADTLLTAWNLTTWGSTSRLDVLWLLAYAVWGAAALDPSMVSLTEPARAEPVRFSRARLTALALAALVAPAVLAVQQGLGLPRDTWAVVLGSVAVFGLVIARMKLSLDQVSAAHAEREAAQVALAHSAAHDSLTGLANRAQAMTLVRGALGRAQRSGALVGLLFVDLDGFKQVNDTLGHAAGDEVLTVVADRMQACVRGGDVVARLGGDEFVVLLEPVDEEASAVAVADRVVSALAAPLVLRGGREVSIGTSVGVAVAQDGATDPERLLHEADVAVYRAKTGGRGRTEVFDASLREELDRRQRLQTGLSQAIRDGGLQLRHEPVVDLASRRFAGYEVQVGWPRPGAAELARADLLPVAERSDLVCELDTWVLREATRQAAGAPVGSAPAVVLVPLSGRHLQRPRVVTDVVGALDASRLDPGRLVLVVAAADLADDVRLLAHLGDLRARGVRVCVDGFGTQEGPTDRWTTLPVDLVRVDPDALSAGRPRSSTLLRLTVETAHTFGWEVIGGGAADAAQVDALAAAGCRYAQGPLTRRTVTALSR